MSMPRRRAMDERTWPASSFSPSISLLLRTSAVRVCRTASCRRSKSQRLHVPDQAALPVTHRGEEFGQLVRAPVKPGPVFELVDIHSPHLLRRLYRVISASVQIFSAWVRRIGRFNLRKAGLLVRVFNGIEGGASMCASGGDAGPGSTRPPSPGSSPGFGVTHRASAVLIAATRLGRSLGPVG